MFDTHAHLCAQQFDTDREQTLRRSLDAGVCLFLEAGTSIQTSRSAIALAQSHEGVVCAAGIHPHDAKEAPDDFLTELEALLSQPRCVAIGEIGLDYHYDFSPRDVQKQVFDEQLALAAKNNLPVIVHDREAHQDIYNMLSAYKGKLTGVMHCYSGSVEDAKKYLDMGFYLGFDGPITFKNAHRPIEVAQYVPLERILCETDSPYLTPVPFRGQRNEPMYVKYVVEMLARIKNIPFEQAANATLENGKRLFGIK